MYAHNPLDLYILCLPNISKMSQKVCFSSTHGFHFKEITGTEFKGERLFLHSKHCQMYVQVALILTTTNEVHIIYMPTKYHKNRGGSRISGKGVHMYKGVCVWVGIRFADSIYFFS